MNHPHQPNEVQIEMKSNLENGPTTLELAEDDDGKRQETTKISEEKSTDNPASNGNVREYLRNTIQYVKNFWNHPAGPLTIFFWAPAFKWGLVLAGLSDLKRPAENLSILQAIALAATGTIWCRYSLVVTPKNYSLFSVNLFIAGSQCYQLYRSLRYQYFS